MKSYIIALLCISLIGCGAGQEFAEQPTIQLACSGSTASECAPWTVAPHCIETTFGGVNVWHTLNRGRTWIMGNCPAPKGE